MQVLEEYKKSYQGEDLPDFLKWGLHHLIKYNISSNWAISKSEHRYPQQNPMTILYRPHVKDNSRRVFLQKKKKAIFDGDVSLSLNEHRIGIATLLMIMSVRVTANVDKKSTKVKWINEECDISFSKVHAKKNGTNRHTWYLSFFLHRQNFWRRKFTPKFTQ